MKEAHTTITPFIVFEGCDGVGTTTCSKLLVERLKKDGYKACWTYEPTQRPIGKQIRQILRRERKADMRSLASMFIADRWDHLTNFIIPNLESGVIVVSDRYSYSTWVYQQDHYDVETLEDLQKGLLPPTMLVLLTASNNAVKRRMEGRKDNQIFDDVYDMYAKRYLRILDARISDEHLHYIDTSGVKPEGVVESVMDELERTGQLYGNYKFIPGYRRSSC
jgi:dTMP kinase